MFIHTKSKDREKKKEYFFCIVTAVPEEWKPIAPVLTCKDSQNTLNTYLLVSALRQHA